MTRTRLFSACAVALWALACNSLDSNDNGGAGSTDPEARKSLKVPRVDKASKLDLLFVVDDSNSMSQEQAALRVAFPALLRVLATGDADGDGSPEHASVADLHLGVVSTDLGLSGGPFSIPQCQGSDEGLLQHGRSRDVDSCAKDFPAFLAFRPAADDVEQVASDLGCIASLGTAGCGFEQPLESALKALWPAVDPMPRRDGSNRVQFLAGSGGIATQGLGDNANLGFLRNDPVTGLSIIAVVVVSDEDDCSAKSAELFTPSSLLDPNDPLEATLSSQGFNLRCPLNPDLLFETSRYVKGLRALRPNNEHLVLFAAIAGVPPETVDRDALAGTDFSDEAARVEFYANIREHPRMQFSVDDNDTPIPSDDGPIPCCSSEHGTAFPAGRLVDVAEGFGENGLIQSICADDFGPAAEAIAALIGRHLAPP
jgi:hypothetical protein